MKLLNIVNLNNNSNISEDPKQDLAEYQEPEIQHGTHALENGRRDRLRDNHLLVRHGAGDGQRADVRRESARERRRD